MHQINNPAQRLLEIINRGASQNGGRPVLDVWGDILSTPVSDQSLLVRRIGYVMGLPSQIKSAIESLEEYNPAIYLKWLPQVENAFKVVHFQHPWSQFIQYFDTTVIYGMEVSSDLLSRKSPELIVEQSTLSSILDDIEDLISKISDIEAPHLLKDIILENLIRIKQAIEEYSIRGITPIQREFSAFIAQAAIHNNMEWKSPKEGNFWDEFWKTMTRLGVALTIIVSSIAIGKESIKAIEYIGNVYSEQHQQTHHGEGDVIDAEVIET